MRDIAARICVGCHASFVPSREDQLACSSTCRQRKKRGTYVISDEDRAAMRRAAELVPVPVPPLDPDAARAHILGTAVRT